MRAARGRCCEGGCIVVRGGGININLSVMLISWDAC